MKTILSDGLILEVKLPRSENTIKSSGMAHFIEYVLSREKIIVFSPHLDDAVLSMGSLISYIAKEGIPVEIITVFTEGSKISSSAIQTLLRNAQFTDVKLYFESRRKEDIIALAELKVHTTQHLGYTDAAWRSKPDGSALYPISQLAPKIDRQDKKLEDTLIRKFKKIIGSTDKLAVFAPLARGKHVDHQMVRNIATTAFPRTIYYQDFPYSDLYENEDSFISERNLEATEWKGDYQAKKNAILQYVTQRYSLFYRGAIKLPYEKYFVPPNIMQSPSL